LKDISIVILTPHDPEDRSHWSGTPHFLVAEMRQRYARVTVISGRRSRFLLAAAARLLRPWRIDPLREMTTARLMALLNGAKLERLKPDVVFGLGASHMIAALKTPARVVHFSDSTFQGMIDYYELFTGFSPRTVRQGNAMERAVLQRADALLMASDWVANSAVVDYGVPADRITVAPLGANIDTWPTFDPDRDQGEVCRLLFVGRDWSRKGGDLAYAVLRGLLARGHRAELHVVGCDPPIPADAPGVHRHGFLRKSDPGEFQRLEDLYRTSSFFILPTRAEAYGVAFAEASAFGLPSLAPRTGGVPTVVEHGVNGLLFPLDASAETYVDAIERLWSDPSAYRQLQRSSRTKFERDLNWRAWGDHAERVIDALVAEQTD